MRLFRRAKSTASGMNFENYMRCRSGAMVRSGKENTNTLMRCIATCKMKSLVDTAGGKKQRLMHDYPPQHLEYQIWKRTTGNLSGLTQKKLKFWLLSLRLNVLSLVLVRILTWVLFIRSRRTIRTFGFDSYGKAKF